MKNKILKGVSAAILICGFSYMQASKIDIIGTETVLDNTILGTNEKVNLHAAAAVVDNDHETMVLTCYGGGGIYSPTTGKLTTDTLNSIWIRIFDIKTKSWQNAKEILIPQDGQGWWDPVLVKIHNNLILFAHLGHRPGKAWKTYGCYSSDGGLTWNPAQPLPDGIQGPLRGGNFIRKKNKRSEVIFFPSSREYEEMGCGLTCMEKLTFKNPKSLFDPKAWKVGQMTGINETEMLIHANVWQNNEMYYLLARTTCGYVAGGKSKTLLKSFSITPTKIPNNFSSFELTPCLAYPDNFLMVYNPISFVRPTIASKIGWKPSEYRYVLSVGFIPKDIQDLSQLSVTDELILENDPSKSIEYSYPAVVTSPFQTSSDIEEFCIFYTVGRTAIKMVRIRVNKI